MTLTIHEKIRATALACLVLASPMGSASAETAVGSSIESRVTLAFSVREDALAGWAPEGWTPVAFPRGPLAGANLVTNLIDQKAGYNADGAPTDPVTRRAVAFLGLAKDDAGDAMRIFVYRVLASDGANVYGTSRAAQVMRSVSQSGPANAGRDQQDRWTITSEDGNMDVALSFVTGTPIWGPNEARPFSPTDQGFSRIYRYDQLSDVVTSKAMGKPLRGSFEMSTTIPELAQIFDGSETLVAIIDVPVYRRDIFLP